MTKTSRSVPAPKLKIRVGRYLPLLLLLGLAVHLILPQITSLEHSLKVIEGMLPWAVGLALLAQVLSYVGSGYLLRAISSLVGQELSVVRGALINLAASSIGLVAGGAVGSTAATYRWVRASSASAQGAGLAGGVPPLLNNMLFFWVFGPEIEDVMGPVRYLVFYLLGGLAATLAQVVMAPNSTVPNLGASGAIAAVMGGFLITYPRDRIRTVLLFGWFARVTFIPAVILVGLWFLTQLFSEMGALAQTQSGGVAYMAHIGGFVFGAAFARIFETRQRRSEQGLE